MLEFDHDHGRFFSGKLLPKLWNLYLNALNYLPVVLFFCRADYFNKAGGFQRAILRGKKLSLLKGLRKFLKLKV